MDNLEIELKVILSDPKKFKAWLKKNAKFKGKRDQVDRYFNPPHKDFIFFDSKGQKRANDFLRVRTNPDTGAFTFKRHHPDTKGKRGHVDEYETAVTSPKKLIKILDLLDFVEIATINKHRESYQYADFEIECDQVEDLGHFFEVELKSKVKNPKVGYKKISDFLDSVGVDWQEARGGYLQMMWSKDFK